MQSDVIERLRDRCHNTSVPVLLIRRHDQADFDVGIYLSQSLCMSIEGCSIFQWLHIGGEYIF